MIWKDLGNKNEINYIEFIKNYLNEKPDTKLYIGTDSQNRNKHTDYAFVIVLHYQNKGAKVIYSKLTLDRIKDSGTRLLKEVEYSLQIASELRDGGLDIPITIDIDFNPDERWLSNKFLTSAIGWVKGMGFECRAKPDAFCASYCADHLVKM